MGQKRSSMKDSYVQPRSFGDSSSSGPLCLFKPSSSHFDIGSLVKWEDIAFQTPFIAAPYFNQCRIHQAQIWEADDEECSSQWTR